VRKIHVLTVSSSLPMRLLDELLTRTEAILHDHGAARVWVDPTQPGTTVLAEFPDAATSGTVPAAALAEVDASV
jgi:hypothetical protein